MDSAGFTADVGSILADGTVLTDKVSAKANLLQQGQFFYDSTNKYVWMYSTSNPAIYYNGSLECWYRGTALSNGNIVYASEKNYITFQDLELKYGGGHGLQVANCTNILTQRLTISYVGGSYLTGTTRYGNGMEVWGGGSNITLQNNDVSQTFDEGITTQYKSVVTQNNIIIQDNIVDKCGRGCALSSFGSPGASISNFYCRRNVFTNCGLGWSIPTVSNGEGKGIQLNINDNMTNGNVTENIIQNTASGADPIGQGILVIGGAWNINKNWIQNTHNSAIRVYSDPTLIVSYNAVVGLNGKPAIFLNSWTGYNTNETLIVNNTVYDNNNKDTTVIKLGVDGGYEVSRVTMNNNIIMMAGNSANELIQVPSGSDVTLDYNLCYRTTAGPLVNWKGTNYMQADWEAYKAASSQDANSPAPNDPKFVSTVVPDFHLQPTSTCINSGVDVGVINFGVDVGVIKSYKAPVPKTTAPNIGAFANVKKNLGPIYLLLLGD